MCRGYMCDLYYECSFRIQITPVQLLRLLALSTATREEKRPLGNNIFWSQARGSVYSANNITAHSKPNNIKLQRRCSATACRIGRNGMVMMAVSRLYYRFSNTYNFTTNTT